MYNINILPPKLRKKQKKVKIGNPTYAPFLFMGVVAAAVFLNFQIEAKLNNITEEKLLLQDEIKTVQESVNEVERVVSEIQAAKRMLVDVPEEMPGEMPQMTSNAIKWDLLLDEISATTPPEVTITNIKQNESTGLIEIQANTYTLSHMARMKESFEKSNYFGSIDIPSLEQKHTNLLSRPLEVSFVLVFAYYPDGNKQDFPDAPPAGLPGTDPSQGFPFPNGNNENLTPEERDAQREAEREARRQQTGTAGGTTPEQPVATPVGDTPAMPDIAPVEPATTEGGTEQ